MSFSFVFKNKSLHKQVGLRAKNASPNRGGKGVL